MQNQVEDHSTESVTVLIVDDHELFREGLQRALEFEDDIMIVGQSDTGKSALRRALELKPDVMILDVNLPDVNGVQVAKKLSSLQPQTAIVMLTAYHDRHQVLHVMNAGAMAYCNKDIKPQHLAKTIRAVADGIHVVDDRHFNQAEFKEWLQHQTDILTGPYTDDAEEHYVPLSPRETEILEHVTHGLSNKEIAKQLGISQQTVKNHMTSILNKLNVRDRTQAAMAAVKLGWVRI